MRSITDPALVPPVRHAYHLSLFEHGATDGEELQCATQDEPQANHTLSDYPEEMVLTLLVCDTTQWPQMLDKMSEVQLKRRDVGSAEMLLQVLGAEPGTSRRAQTAGEKDEEPLPRTQHLYHRANGTYQADMRMQGLQIVTPTTRHRAVAVFYHTVVVECKSRMVEAIASNPTRPLGATVKQALKEMQAQGTMCPLKFRCNFKDLWTPLVDDLDLALRFREEGQQASESVDLKRHWAQLRRRAPVAELQRERRAELRGYLQRSVDTLQSRPSVKIRKLGKQAPDPVVEVPLAPLARSLEPEASLQRRLSGKAGQLAMKLSCESARIGDGMEFLLKDIAADPEESNSKCIAAALTSDGAWRQKLCLPAAELRSGLRSLAAKPFAAPLSLTARMAVSEGESGSLLGPLQGQHVEYILESLRIVDFVKCMSLSAAFQKHVQIHLRGLCKPEFVVRPMDFAGDKGSRTVNSRTVASPDRRTLASPAAAEDLTKLRRLDASLWTALCALEGVEWVKVLHQHHCPTSISSNFTIDVSLLSALAAADGDDADFFEKCCRGTRGLTSKEMTEQDGLKDSRPKIPVDLVATWGGWCWEGLARLRQLFGPECTKLLLQMRAVSAIAWNECRPADVAELLGSREVERIQAAFRAKALEAIHAGDLAPGIELELISALDLQTIPWSQVPVKLKRHLGLPFRDKGIDSLALNLSLAVQAKDYAKGQRANFSPLKPYIQQLVVATNETTRLPEDWLRWTGARQRRYTAQERDAWRRRAVASKFKRWPHQKECFEQCRSFLANQTVKAKRDFFVQMATGTGKSLVMADLVAELGPASKACVIVPKLDLMEQMAKLLEDLLPSLSISRVGTGWTASLTADVFVCVRNSAWQLENCSFDLLLLDEAHHYEPVSDSEENGESGGPHLRQVLSLQAAKRIFFSATLVRNSPDFDFSLRPAIEAGIIQDYSIMVPVVSEGDPRPSLVELIQKLPLSRKILAFCSTLSEAKQFTKLLIAAGIPADHYNGDTKQSRRQEILSSFALREADGGIRVLVTVDVLSEGVDLPWADTCLFVSPRRGIRFRQCVGRVLRRESRKLDATVIAPPIVFNPTNSTVTEDQELRRLLQELASVDPVFQRSIGEENMGQTVPLAIKAAGLQENMAEKVVVEQAAELLSLRVLPSILQNLQTSWDFWYQQLQIFCEQNQHVLVPASHKTADGFSLGTWQRAQQASAAIDANSFSSGGLVSVW
ncbi:Probable helicase A859L [Durusdinium trenchii]|uniref:Probable helicase A859L n=1 Tax=Durusdinium trenchii TaxID=1381693 RepID=A0ABP0QLV6_9DINO